MLYITGDTHGDFRRFSTGCFPEQRKMSQEDYVLVCGDFGGVWADSPNERYWLDWLEDKPFTTLFVDGDLFAIEPVTPYTAANLDWQDKASRSTLEMKNPASRPAMKETADVTGYDTIFVGFPHLVV